MKVAIVHDYIKEYGGAERVLESLHAIFPDAPIYTSVYLPSFLGPHRERFASMDIRATIAQSLPFKAKLISPLRLLSPWLFQRIDFSSYDVIIVSATGAYFPNALHKRSAKLICYCHTPPRYLYGYATAREWKKHTVLRVIGEVANHFLRIVDFNASKNVDQYIANSEEVKRRIAKFYRKDAIVVYPPIDIRKIQKSQSARKTENLKLRKPESSGDYYIAGGRLARPKHVDLIMKTCAEQKIPLKVFGKAFAGYGEELEKLATGNVMLLGEVSDEEKWELLLGAKGYIFASEDEDFGILPVEAMAAGTPVIAYRSGGVQETVIDGRTGVFFDELTEASLAKALNAFKKMKWDKKVIQDRADIFSEDTFQKSLRKIATK